MLAEPAQSKLVNDKLDWSPVLNREDPQGPPQQGNLLAPPTP
jgi:hypothetical protein